MEKRPGSGYVSVSEVAPGLFVGAKPPPGPLLRQLGFTMLILAAEEHQPGQEQFPGVKILRPKLLDDGTETAQQVVARACPFARVVAGELARGGRVLSTCQWGYNRSAIVVGLALRMRGWSAGDVLARLRRSRPSYDGFKALGSPEYAKALELGCPS
jgi:hypothetical protein